MLDENDLRQIGVHALSSVNQAHLIGPLKSRVCIEVQSFRVIVELCAVSMALNILNIMLEKTVKMPKTPLNTIQYCIVFT